MKLGIVIGMALALSAAPAVAGERDCMASSDPLLGAVLMQQFYYEEGLGEAPEDLNARVMAAVVACMEKHAVAEEDSELFAELNLGHAMLTELRLRLIAKGANVDLFDRELARQIPSAATTYIQMFDRVESELEKESKRLTDSGEDYNLVENLIGSYTGAVHTTYVAQLRWDARK